MGTGAEIIRVEFVETTPGEFAFSGCRFRVELLGAEAGQDVTDQRSGATRSEGLVFFMGRRLVEPQRVVVRKVDFSHWN